jgi:dTDP-4-amino-4,6-dideoxygalactose transaminase
MPFLEDIWKRKWLTNNGYYHQRLESSLAEFLGVRYISLFSNGTLALLVAFQALNLKGEVITTPYSFVATTHSLWWNGIKPVFVDINPETCNIDPPKIESAITPETTAVLPVHVYGNPCDHEKLKKFPRLIILKLFMIQHMHLE